MPKLDYFNVKNYLLYLYIWIIFTSLHLQTDKKTNDFLRSILGFSFTNFR